MSVSARQGGTLLCVREGIDHSMITAEQFSCRSEMTGEVTGRLTPPDTCLSIEKHHRGRLSPLYIYNFIAPTYVVAQHK